MNLKALICGGGTAGHVTPGISIAEIITEKEPNSKILFVGRENGEENKLITNCGYNLETVKVFGLKRKLTAENLKALGALHKAINKSKELLSGFNPDIVIGTGGYVSFPLIYQAQKQKLPTVIHESNAYPGLVTQLFAKKCNKVLLNFEGSVKHLNKKCNCVTVGNPLRKTIINETRDSARKKIGIAKNIFMILSFGGSGGSELLNENIIEVMRKNSKKNNNIIHFHATGIKYYDKIKKENSDLIYENRRNLIYPFIYDISSFIIGADLIICRAGAMTLSEISKAGVPAILIPSPNVTNNHQYKNAKLFADKKAAILIEEKDLTAIKLIECIDRIKSNGKERNDMSKNLKKLYKPNCHELIYQEIKKATHS